MAYITLNKNNYFNNLDIIAKQTKSIDKIALVLKDNAYGHGSIEMSKMAQEYGIKKAVVQNYEEAAKIEEYFEYVLVLADCPKKVSSKIRYTHHRSADELSSEWFWQNDNFKKVKEHANGLAKEFGFAKLRFHSSNSAALFRNSDFSEDMARVGVAAYGCMQLPSAIACDGFKPVLSLYARKLSTRELKKGQSVGYGAAYSAQKNEIVSNYDFGYGHGFLRACASGYKTPDGHKLVGRISMDNSSFICEKDEILIFNDARKLSKPAQTIAYEILTSLKADIKREIV